MVEEIDNQEHPNTEPPKKAANKVLVFISALFLVSLCANGYLLVLSNLINKECEQSRQRLQSVSQELATAKNELASTKEELEAAKQQIQTLVKQMVMSKIPKDYYRQTYGYDNTLASLQNYLNWEFSLPRNYELHVFDCSESAAYLEWCLENAGFDARIVVGRAPANPTEGHAWVIVHTRDNYDAAIEATVLTGGLYGLTDGLLQSASGRARGIVFSGDPGAEQYYNGYEESFDDIYEAIAYQMNVDEWNWWEGCWGFQ